MKKISFRIPFLAAMCAFLTWHFMWAVYSFHLPKHSSVDISHALVWFSGALLLMFLSVVGLFFRWDSVKPLKQALKLHVLLALLGELSLYLSSYKRDFANPSVLDTLEIWLALAIIVDVAFLILLPPSHTKVRARALFLTIIISIIGVAVSLMLWSSATARIVQSRALQKAASLPYCLQVRGYESTYTPATSLSDLSGFKMQGKWNSGATSYRWQDFHAVLIVQQEDGLYYYNWSYMLQNFVPITESARTNLHLLRPSCEPRSDFLLTIS